MYKMHPYFWYSILGQKIPPGRSRDLLGFSDKHGVTENAISQQIGTLINLLKEQIVL